jgi:hypothetical protein
MSPQSEPMFTFWLAGYPLASAVTEIANVLDRVDVLDAEESSNLLLLGTASTVEGRLPIVDGCAVLGLAKRPQAQHVLVLRSLPLAVAVTHLGEVHPSEAWTARPLPSVLERKARQWGLLGAIQPIMEDQVGQVWFVVHWPHTSAADWLKTWHSYRTLFS